MAFTTNNAAVRLVRAPEGETVLVVKKDTDATISSLAFSPDGELLVGGTHNCIVKVWRVADGHQLYRLERHPGRVLVKA